MALLQRERTNYANGVVRKINAHTKFEVSAFARAEYTASPKFKSRSRDTGCVLFDVPSNFAVLGQ